MYHRKYHIENILNQINEKYGIEINYKNRQKIYNIFDLIDEVSLEMNIHWKRMISIKYLFRKLLEMLGLPFENIKKPAYNKTVEYYDRWWSEVYGFIKDDIT